MVCTNLVNQDWVKFFEVSYDGIIIADGEGRIVYMNSASERLEEVCKDYILGRHAKDLEEEGVYEISVTLRVLEKKDTVSVMQYKGGKQLVITGIPIFEEERIKWVFINERDVTELNQVKQDREKAKKQAEKYRIALELMRKRDGIGEQFIVHSASMEKLMKLLQRIGPTDMSILIEGESGVGKDVISKWIHKNSLRKDKPFVKIDCGSFPENLLESELFGYKKGAFTGANRKDKKGIVETADGGTLFLDEIGEMPLGLQVKLLRLLQDQTFIPVGGITECKVNLRIIAATNRNLQKMVDEGTFRKDLYYRINVVPIKVPPLRERKEDIFYFINYFLKQFNNKYGFHKELSPPALNSLCKYAWPGNVRELSNVVERLVVVTSKANIEIEDVAGVIPLEDNLAGLSMLNQDRLSYKKAIEEFEKKYFKMILDNGETIQQIAESRGLSESTLKRKLKKYKLSTRKRVENGP